MTLENKKKRRPIPDYEGLPKWKIFFKIFGRFIMAFLFFILGIGIPIGVLVFLDDLINLGYYDFFGRQMLVIDFVKILCATAVPIGLFGFLTTMKMFIHDIQRKPYKLNWKPKIMTVAIIAFGIYATTYYVPAWYTYFGIQPQWGPYIAFHGDDGIQISWDSMIAKESIVEYGTDPNNLNLQATGGEFFWQTGQKSYHHCVAIEGLVPEQKYYYRIPGFDSTIYHFTIAPLPTASKDVCFTILGDTQGNQNIQQLNIANMVNSIGMDNLNYTIIVGDNVNADDLLSEWQMVFGKKSYGRIAPYVPYHATSGNHECGNSGDDPNYPARQNFKKYHQNKFLETRTIEPGAFDVGLYYSFNYSNVHMVMLDNFAAGNDLLSDAQLNWLKEDLSRNMDNWRFLCFHLSMYSSSDHGSYPDLALQLEQIIYDYQVHAIFYGHDHIYEFYDINRTEAFHTYAFMCSGGGGSLKQVTNPDKMGTRVWPTDPQYVNSYGNNFINISEWILDNRFQTQRGWQWQLYAERTHHYMKVYVSGDTATFSAYRTGDNSLIHQATYVKT